MKTKFQTKASRAEEEVLSILKDEKNIRKPWSLVSYQLQNRTLQTTSAEAAIIFNTDASVRPGYEAGNREVFVPNLFIKLSGMDEEFKPFTDSESLKKREKTFVYESLGSFPSGKINDVMLEEFILDGVLKKSILSSEAFRFTFLRREYQELFIDKVNEILRNRKGYFIGQACELSDVEIVSCLLGMDEGFLQAFHNFDFQFLPPAVIVYNKGKEQLDAKQAINLIMLNLMGFDIIAVSQEGYADLENVLNPEAFCVLVGEKVKTAGSGKRNSGLSPARMIAFFAAILIVAFVATGFGLDLFKGQGLIPDTPVAEGKQADSAPPEVEGKLPESAPPFAEEKLPESAPPVVEEKSPDTAAAIEEVEPVKPLGVSEKMTFKDPALEKAIRDFLGKDSGDILIDELDDLGNVRFVGPYSVGGSNGFLLSGYSSTDYIDVNGLSHREEGDIKDLSDLGKVPGLYSIEASWQREIDVNSLRGIQINSLVLRHSNISDITALGTIKNLNTLDVGNNYIQDFSPISSLPLVFLSIDDNGISDLSPLTNMRNLSFLSISSNPVKDLSPLESLTRLSGLIMCYVPVSDFSFLSKLTMLENLNLGGTGLTDLSILKNHTRLKILQIDDNNISDLSPLRNMKDLQHLNISMTNVEDLSVLKDLSSLQTINMSGMKFDDKNEAILKELKNVEIWR